MGRVTEDETMTARFAGSRTLGERRRRYLASNERDAQASSEATPPSKAADHPRDVLALRHFPLRKVISPKTWKITLTGLLAACLGAIIVGLEFGGWAAEDALGPGWERLLQGPGASPNQLLQAGLLMASGQLALVIWWARSQSLRDFEGQYRIWLWAALALLLAGWGWLGQWHWVLSDTIGWIWSARFPKQEVLCWLIPLCLVAGLLWKQLSTDMRACKASCALMWLGLAMGLAACVFRLELDRTGWTAELKHLAQAAFQTASCVGIFLSFLVHARFVIHISAEAPELRPTLMDRILQAIQSLFRKLPWPRLSFSALWKRKARLATETPVKTPKRSKKPSAPEVDAKISKPEPSEAKATESAPKAMDKNPVSRKPAGVESNSSQVKAEQPTSSLAAAKNVKPVDPSPSKPAAPKTEPPKPVKTEAPVIAKTAQPSPPTKPPAAPAPVPREETDEDQEDDADETHYRVDRPIDPGQLRGLSKKERRKLRKQHRDAQRNS
jgi:hypothetical protein